MGLYAVCPPIRRWGFWRQRGNLLPHDGGQNIWRVLGSKKRKFINLKNHKLICETDFHWGLTFWGKPPTWWMYIQIPNLNWWNLKSTSSFMTDSSADMWTEDIDPSLSASDQVKGNRLDYIHWWILIIRGGRVRSVFWRVHGRIDVSWRRRNNIKAGRRIEKEGKGKIGQYVRIGSGRIEQAADRWQESDGMQFEGWVATEDEDEDEWLHGEWRMNINIKYW